MGTLPRRGEERGEANREFRPSSLMKLSTTDRSMGEPVVNSAPGEPLDVDPLLRRAKQRSEGGGVYDVKNGACDKERAAKSEMSRDVVGHRFSHL